MQAELAKRTLAALQKRWGSVLHQEVVNLLGYGSGAFPQTKSKSEFASNTLDLLVEVRSPAIFHREVMRASPDDYSGAAGLFGAGLVNWSDSAIFPMHSNHISLDGRNVKYSVIGQAAFREDLRKWRYLSFAGRLHKPVLQIKPFSQGLSQDLDRNREAAAAVAFLLFGGKGRLLSHSQFFCKICEISYMGDVRFSAGAENPLKVQNIVNNNYTKFQNIYMPILKKMSNKIPNALKVQQDQLSFQYTAPSLAYLLTLLPSALLDPISQLYPGQSHLTDRILLGGSAQLPRDLADTLKRINRKSSLWMATENLVSASPINNISYLMAKWRKSKK